MHPAVEGKVESGLPIAEGLSWSGTARLGLHVAPLQVELGSRGGLELRVGVLPPGVVTPGRRAVGHSSTVPPDQPLPGDHPADSGACGGPTRPAGSPGVPGRGDPYVIPGMWFSTELQVTTPVPEWDDQPVRMAQEEEAEITLDGEMRWMLRRQTEFHLIH